MKTPDQGVGDESGDSGYTKKSSKYFILCLVCFSNLEIPKRIARSVFKKMRKYMKGQDQLHASHLPDKVKLKFVSEILKSDFKILNVVIKKKELNKDYYEEGVKKLIKEAVEVGLKNIVLARKETSKNTNEKLVEFAARNKIGLEFSTPSFNKALQVADLFAWATFQKYENNFADYCNILRIEENRFSQK